MSNKLAKYQQLLIYYYGFLQCLHLAVLIRAGVMLFFYQRAPFPILPPPEGWEEQTLPFMIGLGGTDGVGIFLGICFAYQRFTKGKTNHFLGVLSLTIFITGAIVFAAGTITAGAWCAHPVAYWGMTILFTPAAILFFTLLQHLQERRQAISKPGSKTI